MHRVRTAGALVIVLSALTACGVTKTGSPPSPTASTTSSSPTPTTTTPGRPADTPGPIPADLAPIPKRPTPLPATATCQYPASTEPAAKPAQPPAGDNIPAEGTVDATISTRNGNLKIKLDRALAPCTVNSFINLAKQGFYNNTRCHRLTTVDSLQVLQCGDPLGVGTGGPGYTFADEVFPELTYGRGHLAMANSGPNTNGSQFFIVYGAARLPPNYTVFGSLDAPSMGAIDQIARAGTVSENSPGDGAPRIPVTIEQVEVAG